MIKRLIVIVLFAATLLIAACDRAPSVTPTTAVAGNPTPATVRVTPQDAALSPTRPAATQTTIPTATPTPLPTATPEPPSATPSETATAVPTATNPPSINRVRVVRGVLPNGVICPLRTRVLPDAIFGEQLVGRSAMCDLPILSYRVGQGEIPLVVVGGIHGGYEWNTILLAHALREYLDENPDFVPPQLSLYLVPNANPDGLYAVSKGVWPLDPPPDFGETIPGRFNGRGVDLNRNWDCDWAPQAVWGNEPVSGGSEPFSEAETAALRDFLLALEPAAVIFLHSAAEGVYPAGCGQINSESVNLAEIYREASGYPPHESFEGYPVTGDAGNWLSTRSIPAITVELSTHESLDWEQNLAGLQALMKYLVAQQ
jgi:predicted deacylase